MRLGAPLFKPYATPSEWVAVVQSYGYRAAYCPVKIDAADEVIRAYAQAAQDADIVIAEVGVWNNPLSSDPAQREAAVETCKKSLLLAEKSARVVASTWPAHVAPSGTARTRSTSPTRLLT